MMKAREYDRRFFTRGIQPKVFRIYGSEIVSNSSREVYCNNTDLQNAFDDICEKMQHADEIGSIIDLRGVDFKQLFSRIESLKSENTIFSKTTIDEIQPFLQAAELLAKQYEVVVSNPPYVSSKYMTENLSSYITKHYTDYKADVFAAFMVRFQSFCRENGHIGFISPYVWMFIQSYEKLRNYIYDHMNFSSIVQLEYNAFEAACVPVGIFTLRNSATDIPMVGIKLSEFKGSDVQAPKLLEAIQNKGCGYRYTAQQSNFSKIPGSPVAYWVSDAMLRAFDKKSVQDVADTCMGMTTGDNERFLRLWYEVKFGKIYFTARNSLEAQNSRAKWFPYHKGGEFRRWYGNNDYLVNWLNDGEELRRFSGSTIRNTTFYFQRAITWSLITSSTISFRYRPIGFLFGDAGPAVYPRTVNFDVLFGMLNTKIIQNASSIINPTINSSSGVVSNFPAIKDTGKDGVVSMIVKECVAISKIDWDSYEMSWDFKKHPLM